MFPELFRIPGLGIPIATYGVLLAIGFIVALWLTARLAARDGLPKERIYDLGLYILASALIGSKVLMVITEWNDYRGEWRRIFSFDLWRSGGVYYGGFLIALLVSSIISLFVLRPQRAAVVAATEARREQRAAEREGLRSRLDET